MECPATDRLACLLDGALLEDELRVVEEHLDACARCWAVVEMTLRGEAAQPQAPTTPPVTAVTSPGVTVGRYTVLEWVGSGGMGHVYAAYDPELDRRVALKVLRGGTAAEDGGLRLIHEAQALARVSHRNVVVIHDVGRVGTHAFIAMEWLDGLTLTRWLAEAPRSLEAVLEVFGQAARGLAAAHEAGLVHRDFKPDHVIVTRSGRVCVTDFGLVQIQVGPSGPPAAVGTPRFMAPEQRAGLEVDSRADQHAWAVALDDALRGVRLPAWLSRLIDRARAPAPEDRYASMGVLVAALDRRGRARGPRTALVLAGLVAAGALLAHARAATPPPCREVNDRAAALWGEAHRTRVQAAFARAGRPYAAHAASWVDQAFTRYLTRWTRQKVDVCLASRAGSAGSASALAARDRCLDARALELEALVGVFATADAQVVDRAVSAARGLSSLTPCEDGERLVRLGGPGPNDRDGAHRRALLGQARALLLAGRYERAAEVARRLLEECRHAGDRAMEAKGTRELGLALAYLGEHQEAATTLHDAALKAQAAGDDELAFEAYAQLANVYGDDLRRSAEARLWLAHAEALLMRAGPSPANVGRLAELHATLAYALDGDPRAALSHAREALSSYEAAGEPHGAHVNEARAWIASILSLLGELEEAERHQEQVLAQSEQELSPRHPGTAADLNNLGSIYLHRGKLTESLEVNLRALSIRAEALGPDHPLTAWSRAGVASARLALGEVGPAIKLLAEASEVLESRLAPTHPRVLLVNVLRARAEAEHGRAAEALVAARRAVAASAGASAVVRAEVRLEAAAVALAAHRWSEAQVLSSEGLSLLEGARAEGPIKGYGQSLLARALVTGGAIEPGAIALMQSAQRQLARHPGPYQRAQAALAELVRRVEAASP